jgi:sulfite reductase (ferredoxin)
VAKAPEESPEQATTLLSASVEEMSSVERTKVASAGFWYVGGPGGHTFRAEVDELERGERDTLSGGAADLSKHFGIYRQRERLDGRKSGAHIFMVRLKCPAGGEISPAQWLALHEGAARYADGTLRLTTRQAIQLHHVTGKTLRPLIAHLNAEYRDRGYHMTTLGGCGDVNRNTMCSPIDDLDPELPLRSRAIAHRIASELAPKAGADAYAEIFFARPNGDGYEPVAPEEPVYGRHYLPRKFKVGIAHPHDGSIDILTQDVGLLPVIESGRVAGYDLYVGGGLGMTHNQPQTKQLLGLYLGRIPADQCVAAVRAVALVQRDHGERKDRRQARLKYTIRRLGQDVFARLLVEQHGIDLRSSAPAPLPPNRFFHGYSREHGDDRWMLGIPVASGRLQDDPNGGGSLRSAVREIVTSFDLGMRLTPNQDVLLCHIPGAVRERIDEILHRHGVPLLRADTLTGRQALACPAKPTCGLAMTDAEHALPGLVRAIEDAGLGSLDVVIRISGCPNSCSRPPTAEIGIIGYGKNDHIVQVGGARDGSRIGRVLYERVPGVDLCDVVVAILRAVREHADGQAPGDMLHSVPLDQLRGWVGYPA